jgi:excinuclease ABC subunit B
MVHRALDRIKTELQEQYELFLSRNKLLEAQRIKSRTEYDIEMLEEMGYCSGIENYSSPLAGRKPGERPGVLIDYFPKDFVTFIDESHVTLSQIGAMYAGDEAGKLP